VLLLVS